MATASTARIVGQRRRGGLGFGGSIGSLKRSNAAFQRLRSFSTFRCDVQTVAAAPPACYALRFMNAALDVKFDHAPEDLWVFGYGSLIWRPGFAFVERVPARVVGLHRSLCIYSFDHRGTPERP